MSLRGSPAFVVKDIAMGSALKCSQVREMSSERAANLSKKSYTLIRTQAKSDGLNYYPSYGKLQKTKEMCYPNEGSITVTETMAQVELESLLNHSCSRILKLQREVVITLDDDLLSNLALICKWGCDGSSQQEYKQKFADSDSSDAYTFITSLVPIQLNAGCVVVWKNPKPSSSLFF